MRPRSGMRRDRAHEVRRDRGGVQTALLERLVHQGEIHLLEVAQATVHEFRGTTGVPEARSRCSTRPTERPRGRGIESAADAGDTAADDQHVEFALGHAFEVAPALLRVEEPGSGDICTPAYAPGRNRGT